MASEHGPTSHPVATCAIGSVVDSSACLFGFAGLRVVDASILPEVPSANTNLPVMMAAEKCAALITGAANTLPSERGGARERR